MAVVVTGIRDGGIVFVDPELTVTFEDKTSVFVKYMNKEKLISSLEQLDNLELADGLFLTIRFRNIVTISHEGHEVNLEREELIDKLYRG
ncbi:MAG: hypothetical protein ACD_19C00355G0015 [uncultured bacterium]|nr:MAG: hypothetical protein ACD_19C00355G0015 [uncultured bacterium]